MRAIHKILVVAVICSSIAQVASLPTKDVSNSALCSSEDCDNGKCADTRLVSSLQVRRPPTFGRPKPGPSNPNTPNAPQGPSTGPGPHIGSPNPDNPGDGPEGPSYIGRPNDPAIQPQTNLPNRPAGSDRDDLGWDAYSKRGTDVSNSFGDAVLHQSRDKTYPPIEQRDRYEVTTFDNQKPMSRATMVDFGMNPDAGSKRIVTRDRDAPNSDSDTEMKDGDSDSGSDIESSNILDAFYSKEGRGITIFERFAKNDPYRPKKEGDVITPDKNGNTTPLRSSEMVFQQWRATVGVNDVKNLDKIMIPLVSNKGSENVIDRAFNELKLNKETDRIDSLGPNESGAKKNAYDALAGTDNVRPIFHMVQDHRTDLGDVKELKITAWHEQTGKGGNYAIGVELIR